LKKILKELHYPFNLYKFNGIIGDGGYGCVIHVEDKKTNNEYAMKIVPCDNDIIASKVITEALTLIQFKSCESICCLHECFFRRNNIEETYDVYLIMDLYKNGSISDYLKILKEKEKQEKDNNEIIIPEKTIIKWMINLSDGLIELHNKKYIHRDIKPANLLFDNNTNTNNNNILLADFGLVISEEKSATANGTIGYMSPEQLNPYAKCDYGCDIWSMGIVLFELLTKKLQNCFTLPEQIINEKFPSKYYCNELKIILTKLLKQEPQNRPNAIQAKLEFQKIVFK